eukprot:5231613-Amphidinium_carterae.1
MPLESGDSPGDADEDMVGDEEPSAKKPRGMGSGTPPASPPTAELPSQAAAESGTPPPADGSAGEAACGSAPSPAAAEAAAVTEEDIQAVLAQVDSGADWESAAKRKGRPPKAAVMPHGALDKYVVSPSA